MNKLSYIINKEALLMPSSRKEDGFQIVIDGRPSGFFFNILEFLWSGEREGIYGIFDGACMLKGCCGLYLDVVHEKDKIIWKRIFDGGCPAEDNMVTGESLSMPDDNDAYEIKDLYVNKDYTIKASLEFNKDDYWELAEKLSKGLFP